MVLTVVAASLRTLYPPLEEEGVDGEREVVQGEARLRGLPGVEDCDLHAFLRRYRREAPLHMWLGLVLGALVFQLTPLFTIGVPLWASALSAKSADRHAYAVTTSSVYLLRQLMFLLKMAAGLAWGADPVVRARLGLPPLAEDPGSWRRA